MANEQEPTKKASTSNLLVFSKPWDLSDCVLLVESSTFHVHRNILMMWSDVFKRMFTAEFREKASKEVELPGKKANEIQEMLLMIYPTSSKQIDRSNFLFLLSLGREYMMAKLTEKCEDYLIRCLENPEPNISFNFPTYSCYLCLEFLDIAQEYGLERLQVVCTEKIQNISFYELRNHETYEKISLPNYRKIFEGKIKKMEEQLNGKVQELNAKKNEVLRGEQAHKNKIQDLESANKRLKSYASSALRKFENVIQILEFIAPGKSPPVQRVPVYSSYTDPLHEKLVRIKTFRWVVKETL